MKLGANYNFLVVRILESCAFFWQHLRFSGLFKMRIFAGKGITLFFLNYVDWKIYQDKKNKFKWFEIKTNQNKHHRCARSRQVGHWFLKPRQIDHWTRKVRLKSNLHQFSDIFRSSNYFIQKFGYAINNLLISL